MIGDNPDKHMWIKFCHTRSSDNFEIKWLDYLKESNLPDDPMPWQHVTIKYFEFLLQTKLKPSMATLPNEADVDFTYEKENAIRYMSGHVKLQASSKCGTTDFLVSKDPDVADATESTDWIKLIDCGALVYVTNECFQVFLSIECAICRYVQHHETKDSEVFVNMEKIVISDNSVLIDWLMITGGEE